MIILAISTKKFRRKSFRRKSFRQKSFRQKSFEKKVFDKKVFDEKVGHRIKPISLQAPALSNPTRSVAMGGVKSKSSLDPRLVPTRDKSRFSPNSPLPHSARFSPIRGDSTTVPSTYPQRVVTMEAETKKLEESSLRSSPTAELVKGDTNYLHHNAPLQPLHGSINRHPQAVGTDFTSNTASSNSNSQALNSGPPMVNPFAENIRLVF